MITMLSSSKQIVSFLMQECKHGVIGICPKCDPKTFKAIQKAHKRMKKKLSKINLLTLRGNDN